MKQEELQLKRINRTRDFFSRILSGVLFQKLTAKFSSNHPLSQTGKFIISVLISTPLFAAEINLFHENNEYGIEEIKETLQSRYFIPNELIEKIEVQNCERVRQTGKLDLCLKNNGDLVLVSVDRRFVNESLKAFRAH